MYAECPLCQTLFRITHEQLEQANGKVRCCCCEEVFDARKQLRSPPVSTEEKSRSEPPPVADEPLQTQEEPATIPAADTLELEELLDLEEDTIASSSEPDPADASPRDTEAETVIETTREAPDLESLLSQETPKPRSHTLFWVLASLLALTTLLLQLAWSERMQLIQHPYGVTLLNTLCQQLGCQVPQLKDRSKIKVVSRNISSHPETPDALLLQLTIISDTPYDQPYPQLQVNLYNTDNSLVASRTFTPIEYLPKEWQPHPALMPAKREITITMELVDPGETVTGFKLEFL